MSKKAKCWYVLLVAIFTTVLDAYILKTDFLYLLTGVIAGFAAAGITLE